MKKSSALCKSYRWRMLSAGTALCVAAQAGAAALEEVVVTAQKREQNLQEVPISITALGADDINNRGIVSLSSLNAVAPNVMFRESPTSNLISVVSIRGSVAGNPAIWMDPLVGLYLNGVYLGKSQGSVFDVVDIERIEVLRGPQGTLFGRNTEGGAINFITRQPSGEFSGRVGMELGNYDHRALRLNMDLPKMGIASASFGLLKQERDGWAENLTGPDMGAVDNEAARASVLLDFSDRFRAIYDFDYSKADNTPPPVSMYALNGWRGTPSDVLGAAGPVIESELAPHVRNKRPSKVSNHGEVWERNKTSAHTLTLDYAIGESDQIKYIFSHRNMEYDDSQDSDGTPLGMITVPVTMHLTARYNRSTDYEQESHELQWIGTKGPLDYVLGLYYFEDEGDTHGAQHTGIFFQPPQRSDYGTNTRSKAVFGQIDYALGQQWTVTLGARHTKERKGGWSHRFGTDGFDGAFVSEILPYTSYSEDFSDTTPMAAVSWALTDDLNFYARVAKGFKSGGFSSELAVPEVSVAYEPQTSTSAEVGVKSILWNDRLRLNAAVYRTEISDQQLTQLIPGTTQSLMVNAGESTYKGFELEATVVIAEGWQLQFNYGYLDASFDKFPDNALNLGPDRPIIETASNRVAPYAPRNTYSAYLNGLLMRTAWGELRAMLEYSYTDQTYLYAANKSLTAPNAGGQYLADLVEISSLENINARLQLRDIPAGRGTVDLSLWVRNLTDEDEMQQGIDYSAFRTASWQAPRTYMLTADYRW